MCQIFAFAQNVHTYNNVIEDMRATLVEKADTVSDRKKECGDFFFSLKNMNLVHVATLDWGQRVEDIRVVHAKSNKRKIGVFSKKLY